MTDPRTYGMTTRATELLAVIREWRVLHGGTPTYDQMAAELGVRSKATVHRLVKQLAERGLVRCLPGRHQSIALVEPQTITLPDDLYARLSACAKALGLTADQLAVEVILDVLPSPSTTARERDWSSSPTPF
jgi:SOS-response transcriptional repressor LexA